MFTSKLPRFANSAKRPSGPNDGSTSFLSSNIPVSVRKANLFTPQPKRSLHGTFTSTGTKPYMTTEKKYQRVSKPAPDRDEQMKMFGALVDYLKTYEPGFPIPDPKKFLLSVSTTETARLFEVLLTKINPNFKINKLEVDVPEALAALDYPYIRSVTKSALVSVTTRQAVGNLLVIFNWLINHVKIMVAEDFDTHDVIIMDMLRGEDGANDENPTDSYEDIDKQIEATELEVQEIDNRLSEINAALDLNLAFEVDSKKCQEYVEESEAWLKDRQPKLERAKQDLGKLQQDYYQALEKYESLERDPEVMAVRNQPPSVRERLQEEVRSLEKRVASEENELNMMDRTKLQDLERLEEEFRNVKDRFGHEESRIQRETSAEAERLRSSEQNQAQNEKMWLEIATKTLEANRQTGAALLKRQQLEIEQWSRIEQRVVENCKIARAGAKLLSNK